MFFVWQLKGQDANFEIRKGQGAKEKGQGERPAESASDRRGESKRARASTRRAGRGGGRRMPTDLRGLG